MISSLPTWYDTPVTLGFPPCVYCFGWYVVPVVLILFFLMVFIAPQSFALIKLPLLSIVIILIIAGVYRGKYKIKSPSVILYYCIFSVFTLIWTIVGLYRGNAEQAVMDAIRVYIVFMWIYAILTIYISNTNYQKHLDFFFSATILGIGFFSFYLLADTFFHLNLIGEYVKEQMLLQIGIHKGYIQMNNVNIGMLCFLLPFIFSRIIMLNKRTPYYLYVVLFHLFSPLKKMI